MPSYVAKGLAEHMTQTTGIAWKLTRRYVYRRCDCIVGRHLDSIVWGVTDGTTMIESVPGMEGLANGSTSGIYGMEGAT